MLRTLLAFVLLGGWALTGCGSFAALPDIPGRHWRRDMFGAELYTSTGEEVACFVGGGAGDPAQVCIFELPGPCEYFETNEAALKWTAEQYRKNPPQP